MSPDAPRIAVIRFSSLGDIVLTGPVVRALKRRFPDSRLVYITTEPFAELVPALPGVDETVAIRRHGEGFIEDISRLAEPGWWDRAADLQGSPRSAQLVRFLSPAHQVTDRPPRIRRAMLLATRLRLGIFRAVPDRALARLGAWGVEDDGGSLELNLPEGVNGAVRERWRKRVENAIVIVPGAKHATKRWPEAYWKDVVERLPGDRAVVVIGGPGECPDSLAGSNDGRLLDLTGRTSILEAAAVMRQASVVVSGDTGPMHLAVAVGAPLVALFGPTVREFGFYPYRHAKSIVLERSLFCRPCSAHGSNRCPLGHHHCLRWITPGEVASAAVSLMVEQVAEKRS